MMPNFWALVKASWKVTEEAEALVGLGLVRGVGILVS